MNNSIIANSNERDLQRGTRHGDWIDATLRGNGGPTLGASRVPTLTHALLAESNAIPGTPDDLR
jgi:hypothetical protein